MYKGKKYRPKKWPEIKELIAEAARDYAQARRIFLADGNALSLPSEILTAALQMINERFPRLERISIYGSPQDILGKTVGELRELRRHGLELVYMGIESGSERVLKMVKKGITPGETIMAGKKARECGFALSATIISGLGGAEYWEEHAVETAGVVSAINPEYLGALTLFLREGAPLLRSIEKGQFTMLAPWQILRETRLMIENLELNDCLFRSNHASNYFDLGCILNREKEAVLERIDRYLASPFIKSLPVEINRGL
jgi:radical SAM superfamily enzyme YgiQ (UPF0313 family)